MKHQAKVQKETEKALLLAFRTATSTYETLKASVWMPKSQITIVEMSNEIITFTANNDWIMKSKISDACKYVRTQASKDILNGAKWSAWMA